MSRDMIFPTMWYVRPGACLTADPGVPSLIGARSHTFMEIDHEIISTVIYGHIPPFS